jgi:SAM-dependent methyltransferase
MVKRRLLGVVVAVGLALWACKAKEPEIESPHLARQLRETGRITGESISLRNGLESFVEYTVKPAGALEPPEHRILDTGEIDTFTEGEKITVTFSRLYSVVRQDLEPGKTYSLVRDDTGEVVIKEGWHGLEHSQDLAPFVATPMAVAQKMLELAGVGENDVVYDLGCGDGRIVILAAQKFGARGVGIDFNPKRIDECVQGALEAGVEDRTEFRLGDVLKADFSDATVVTVYLLTRSHERLRPLLEEQLKSGSLVVTHNYSVPGWEAREIDRRTVELEPTDVHILFLYRR